MAMLASWRRIPAGMWYPAGLRCAVGRRGVSTAHKATAGGGAAITLHDSPEAVVEALTAEGAGRGYVYWERQSGETRAFPGVLQSVGEEVAAESPDYHRHEAMFFKVSPSTGSLMSAFIHDTRRGQAAGGIRNWRYSTVGQMITDGLRLSLGMGRKNALAGLWWGGGKGVVHATEAVSQSEQARIDLYHDYGDFLTSLRGCYIGAEDVGTVPQDMARVFERTRFTTCIPESVGGSGNPSGSTATGVVCAMEAALDFLGMGSLEGKVIAMQGVGNVSSFMIDDLVSKGVQKIIGTDVSKERCDAMSVRYRGKPVDISLVAPGDNAVLGESADIVAPNALGGTINEHTIPKIKAKIVCGAANNQLQSPLKDAQALHDRGIVFVPDFVANRMGIVQCANEQYGYLTEDDAILSHFGRSHPNSVYNITMKTLSDAKSAGITTTQAATALADEYIQQEHPLMPSRGWRIVQDVARQWAH